jgi:hypothetical protein
MKQEKQSVHMRVLKTLMKGQTVSPRQIAARYKVSNPHNPVYMLEEAGIEIKRQYKKISGSPYFTVRYSLDPVTAAKLRKATKAK